MSQSALLDRRRALFLDLGLALFSLAFVCLSVHWLTPVYMENDDVTIMDYAMQGFPVRYAGILFTSLLHLGYVHFPETAWYGISLYGLHALSVFLWLKLLLRVFRPWLAALYGVVLLGYYLVFLAYLDYTSTSVMLCTVALSWAYVRVMERRHGYWGYLGPGLVFTLGMLVRPHGVPGSILYTLPLGLLAAWAAMRGEPWRPELRRLALIGVVFLAPAAVNFALDDAWRAYTATPQQAQYEEFNAVRGKLQRISRARKRRIMTNPRLLAKAHWTHRDAAFFFNWNFLDERTYSPDKLAIVLKNAPPPHPTGSAFVKVLERRLPPYNMTFLLLLAPLPLLLLLARRRPGMAAMIVVLPLYELGLTTLMYMFFAFTHRVELPFETATGFCAVVVLGWLAARETGEDKRNLAILGCLGVAVAAAGLYAGPQNQLFRHRDMAARGERVEKAVAELNRDFAGSVILLEPKSGLSLEHTSPLKVIHLEFTPVQLGWSTFSPRFYKQIGALGISHGYELVDALISHDKAYMLGSKGWCKQLLPYATDAGKRHIEIEPVRKIAGAGTLYRFREVK